MLMENQSGQQHPAEDAVCEDAPGSGYYLTVAVSQQCGGRLDCRPEEVMFIQVPKEDGLLAQQAPVLAFLFTQNTQVYFLT